MSKTNELSLSQIVSAYRASVLGTLKEVTDAVFDSGNLNRITQYEQFVQRLGERIKYGTLADYLSAISQQGGVLERKVESADEPAKEVYLPTLKACEVVIKKLGKGNTRFANIKSKFGQYGLIRKLADQRKIKVVRRGKSKRIKEVDVEGLKRATVLTAVENHPASTAEAIDFDTYRQRRESGMSHKEVATACKLVPKTAAGYKGAYARYYKK